MSKIHTSLVSPAHAYTTSSTPWILGVHKSAYGKLIHYISGGGMQTFGRTVRQEEISLRQRRFIALSILNVILWICFLVF